MAKSDTVIVRARLVSASPDRTQWKPYAPGLEFDNVYVDIPVPAEHAGKEKGDVIVLDVDGVAVLLDVVATAIDKMNLRYTQSLQKSPYQNHRPY